MPERRSCQRREILDRLGSAPPHGLAQDHPSAKPEDRVCRRRGKYRTQHRPWPPRVGPAPPRLPSPYPSNPPRRDGTRASHLTKKQGRSLRPARRSAPLRDSVYMHLAKAHGGVLETMGSGPAYLELALTLRRLKGAPPKMCLAERRIDNRAAVGLIDREPICPEPRTQLS